MTNGYISVVKVKRDIYKCSGHRGWNALIQLHGIDTIRSMFYQKSFIMVWTTKRIYSRAHDHYDKVHLPAPEAFHRLGRVRLDNQ